MFPSQALWQRTRPVWGAGAPDLGEETFRGHKFSLGYLSGPNSAPEIWEDMAVLWGVFGEYRPDLGFGGDMALFGGFWDLWGSSGSSSGAINGFTFSPLPSLTCSSVWPSDFEGNWWKASRREEVAVASQSADPSKTHMRRLPRCPSVGVDRGPLHIWVSFGGSGLLASGQALWPGAYPNPFLSFLFLIWTGVTVPDDSSSGYSQK